MTAKRLALAVAAAAFTTALVGGAAFAAFQPVQTEDAQSRANPPSGTSPDRGPADRLKAILDRLVASGTISQTQEDAILKAVRDAAPSPKPGYTGRGPIGARGFIGDVFKVASDYLGIPARDIATQLKAGKSLAEIANGTPSKSRQGLVDAFVKAATDKLDKAVTEKKLTADQANAIKAKLATEIGQLVDRKATGAPRVPGLRPVRPTPTPKT